jgi:hypothetical protein
MIFGSPALYHFSRVKRMRISENSSRMGMQSASISFDWRSAQLGVVLTMG